MPNTRDLVVVPKFKILLWSPSGTGKTHFAGTAAQLGKVYFFDFDLRMMTLAGVDADYDSYRDTFYNQPIALAQAQRKLDELKKSCPYETVVLDSLTTFGAAAMNAAMGVVKSAMQGVKRIGDATMEIPTQPDYMAQQSYIEKFIRELVALPCHVIVTAHEAIKQDQESKRIYKQIMANGQLTARLPGLLNEVWRMDVETRAEKGVMQTNYRLLTRADNLHTGRTSKPFAEVIKPVDVPDLKVLHDRVLAHFKQKHPDTYANYTLNELRK